MIAAMSYIPPTMVTAGIPIAYATSDNKLPCYCKEQCSSCGVPREGDMKIVANHHLKVNEYTDYIVTHFLGRGVFGQVVQAVRLQTSQTFAVKVLKNTPSYYEQGKTELSVLLRLMKYGAQRQPVTNLVEAFEMNGHLCLVFELYKENLYEYLKRNRFTPLSVANIRHIGYQLLQALEFLLTCKVIHTDIKPENIMFVNKNANDFEIRLIDFGSAVVTDRPAIECCYLQSRYYRSPEVLVRSEITAASDMFSVGCVLAELYIGYPLMAGNNEYEQLRLIMEMLGPLPNSLIASGKSGTRFFNFYLGNDNQVVAVLKSEEQIDRLSAFKERRKQCHNIRNLQELQHYKRSSHYPENESTLLPPEYERSCFTDLLLRMLCTDPKRRVVPQQAINHTFFKCSTEALELGLLTDSLDCPPHVKANIIAQSRSIALQKQGQQQRQQEQLQQLQQTQMVSQYLPALTTIYQQLSYAPAIYVQNVQVSSQAAAAAAAILAPQPQPIPSQYVTAAFCNPTTLHHFGQAIQQFLSPGSQYGLAPTAFPQIPAQMIPQAAQILPQAVFQAQPQMVFNPAAAAQICYQMQARPPSRSRSPLS
uniref:Protein kinase domain-containing protein n=1 Tax=Panagrolaimus sp. JU765 TaxID=591449 RepID=A0AC34R4E2_9BILA